MDPWHIAVMSGLVLLKSTPRASMRHHNTLTATTDHFTYLMRSSSPRHVQHIPHAMNLP
jgi:hypothetical protein